MAIEPREAAVLMRHLAPDERNRLIAKAAAEGVVVDAREKFRRPLGCKGAA